MTRFEARRAEYQARIEKVLEESLRLPDPGTERLRDAMRYSVLGGGKRLRPLLVYFTGECLGARLDDLDAPAAAVELIHVYSLVHDDLPAMDDDDLRRGRPTCHRAFDEATAILVGDALQALAFDVLANVANGSSGQRERLAMIRILARASGTAGMAGGQAIDLVSVGQTLDIEALENMHSRKTGALIQGSVLLGAAAAGVRAGELSNVLAATSALRSRSRTTSSTSKAMQRCSASAPAPMRRAASPPIRARPVLTARASARCNCGTLQ